MWGEYRSFFYPEQNGVSELGQVIPFWKAFDEANHNVRANFWFWAKTLTGRLSSRRLWRGVVMFLRICHFFNIDSPEIKHWELFIISNFFIGPHPEAIQTWPGLQLGHVLEMHILCDCWCYWVMSYHFGKHLMW